MLGDLLIETLDLGELPASQPISVAVDMTAGLA